LLRGLAIFFVLMNHVNMRLVIAKIPYTANIPALLQRLATVREKAAKEERERYRYKLVVGDPAAK